MYTQLFSEGFALVDSTPPVSSAIQVNGAWKAVGDYNRLVAKFSVGAIASGGTVTCQVRQAQNVSGTGAKALKLSATVFGDTDDNKTQWLEIRTEELDVDQGFDFVRVEIIPTEATLLQVELLGFVGRYAPVKQPVSLIVTK